jgi:DNA polymerase-3 subunit delta'
MEVAEAYSLISRAVDSGRAAHGYLICGDIRGGCAELADMVLGKLFPDAVSQIKAKSHPDVVILEPEGKSRIITVESMRERLVAPMCTTSFCGGWKAGVVVGADRMRQEAANAFLKTLEEPSPRTMFLLLTDAPDAILPTIISRTQRIDLPVSEDVLEADAFVAVEEVMTAEMAAGSYGKSMAGRRLAEILAELKDEVEPEDVAAVRKKFFKTVMKFVRDGMIGGSVPRYQAFRNIEAVEEAYRMSERSMNDEAVLCFMMDRMMLG